MYFDRREDLIDFMKEVNASRALACSLIHGRDDVCQHHVKSHMMAMLLTPVNS